MVIKTKAHICYPLEDMIPGDSFFVPSYDPKEFIKDIDELASALRIVVRIKIGIEAGVYGLRVWRTE